METWGLLFFCDDKEERIMETNQEHELNCPIGDDCNLVFICDTCVETYLIPRRECELLKAVKHENGRVVYHFERICPKCYIPMSTTVSMLDSDKELK